jgi:hypothetical protein
MDSTATKVNTTITDNVTANGGAGACSIFNTMVSGSISEAFNNGSGIQVLDDDTYRTRATASYVTGSHNAKIGFEGAYFGEENDQRGQRHAARVPLRDAGRHVSHDHADCRQPLPVRQHDAAVGSH